MSDRLRIGYTHEFHPNFEHNSWIASEDLESTDPVVQKEVQHWLYSLANPWSETAVSFVVTPNVFVNKEIWEHDKWEAKYISTFYDCLQSIAIAYGETPNEAIDNVTALVEHVIDEHYNYNEDEKPSPIFDDVLKNI